MSQTPALHSLTHSSIYTLVALVDGGCRGRSSCWAGLGGAELYQVGQERIGSDRAEVRREEGSVHTRAHRA